MRLPTWSWVRKTGGWAWARRLHSWASWEPARVPRVCSAGSASAAPSRRRPSSRAGSSARSWLTSGGTWLVTSCVAGMARSYGSVGEGDQGGDGVRVGGAGPQRADEGLGDGADQGGGGDVGVLRGQRAVRDAVGDGGGDQVAVGAAEDQALRVDGG